MNWEYNIKKRKLNDENLSDNISNKNKEHFINSSDNNIYFYSEINKKTIFDLNKEIRYVSQNMLDVANRYDINPPPIKLHINSNGGSIFAAMACVDTILSCPVEIHSIIEGAAASAATLISVVCKKRFIRPHSYMLIHQLSSSFWGKMFEFKDEIQNLENLMKLIKNIYKKHTKIPTKKLDDILNHDIWWDATKCKELKLVDNIINKN